MENHKVGARKVHPVFIVLGVIMTIAVGAVLVWFALTNVEDGLAETLRPQGTEWVEESVNAATGAEYDGTADTVIAHTRHSYEILQNHLVESHDALEDHVEESMSRFEELVRGK